MPRLVVISNAAQTDRQTDDVAINTNLKQTTKHYWDAWGGRWKHWGYWGRWGICVEHGQDTVFICITLAKLNEKLRIIEEESDVDFWFPHIHTSPSRVHTHTCSHKHTHLSEVSVEVLVTPFFSISHCMDGRMVRDLPSFAQCCTGAQSPHRVNPEPLYSRKPPFCAPHLPFLLTISTFSGIWVLHFVENFLWVGISIMLPFYFKKWIVSWVTKLCYFVYCV